MAKCRDCDARILWCEIETKNGIKKIAVDPAPNEKGDLTLLPTHPDAPMKAKKAAGGARAMRYISHRETCSAVDPADRKKYDREPNWVREPEGY